MNSDDGFLQVLATDPTDDVTRLIYADWLNERNDPRGQYLRLELELWQRVESGGVFPGLEERLAALRLSIDPEWLNQAGIKCNVRLHSCQPTAKISAIRVLRAELNCGLVEAKQLVDTRRSLLLGATSLERALRLQRLLQVIPWTFPAPTLPSGWVPGVGPACEVRINRYRLPASTS